MRCARLVYTCSVSVHKIKQTIEDLQRARFVAFFRAPRSMSDTLSSCKGSTKFGFRYFAQLRNSLRIPKFASRCKKPRLRQQRVPMWKRRDYSSYKKIDCGGIRRGVRGTTYAWRDLVHTTTQSLSIAVPGVNPTHLYIPWKQGQNFCICSRAVYWAFCYHCLVSSP